MTFLSFLISLLLVPATATAAPDTDQTFALRNTSNTAATDLIVTFAQPPKGKGQPVDGAIIGSAKVRVNCRARIGAPIGAVDALS